MKRINNKIEILRSLPKTIYFNFKYLPIRQALHLPIILYRPNLINLKGRIEIQGGGKLWHDSFGRFHGRHLSK